VEFRSSFLSDWTRSPCFPGIFSILFLSKRGVPQGSTLSHIIFLIYNTDLVDVCNSPNLSAISISLVDNINVLVFGSSIKETGSILKEIYSGCFT
jgi:hypothetical protein